MKDFEREESFVREKSYLDMTQRTTSCCSGNYEKENENS